MCVLVVDDEPDIRDLLSMTLRRMQVDVETASDRANAIRRLGSDPYASRGDDREC